MLHEACWADGGATSWSAERMRPDVYDEQPELFTGEHIFPWMFEDYGALAPLREAAEQLAAHEWPRLYDPDVLAANDGPDRGGDLHRGPLRRARVLRGDGRGDAATCTRWVTSEYDHNGLRVDGERILGRLIDLVRGRA